MHYPLTPFTFRFPPPLSYTPLIPQSSTVSPATLSGKLSEMDVKLNYVVNCNMRRLNESSKKGSGFTRFATKDAAEKAAEKMNGFQIGSEVHTASIASRSLA